MRRSQLISVLPLCLLLGCSEPGAGDDKGPQEQDGAVAADMAQPPSPASCDPRSQRPQAPELFVGPQGLEAKVLAEMDKAKRTFDILMYEMSRQSYIDKIIELHRRGVTVRVILDGKRGEDYDIPKKAFDAAGVPVKASDARFPYYHVKAMIIDGQTAVIMSANMDMFSAEKARNYGVVDRDPDDLRSLQSIIDADWAGAADPDLSCTRLLVSPVNSLDRLRAHIAAAQKQLDLQVMYLSETKMVETVKQKVKDGVPVRILLATDNFVSGNLDDARDLMAAGAQVKFFYSNHAKLVLSDGAAYVGSENLSWTSLTKNREVGVFVTEKEPSGAAQAQFETDWKNGVAVMPQ